MIAGLTEQRTRFANRRARPAVIVRSRTVRKAEAQLLLAKWTASQASLGETEADLHSIRLSVAKKTEAAAKSAAGRAEIAANLPPLRESEVAKAAEYQRLSIGRDELDREEERIRDALERLETQQEQIGRDMARETDLRDDATAANSRLGEEIIELQKQIDEATHSVKLPLWNWKLPVKHVSPMPSCRGQCQGARCGNNKSCTGQSYWRSEQPEKCCRKRVPRLTLKEGRTGEDRAGSFLTAETI